MSNTPRCALCGAKSIEPCRRAPGLPCVEPSAATPAEVAALRAERDAAVGHWDIACREITTLRAEVKRLREALVLADRFITNGVELGYIRMPSPGTPDPALLTPGIIRAALGDKP